MGSFDPPAAWEPDPDPKDLLIAVRALTEALAMQERLNTSLVRLLETHDTRISALERVQGP